MILYDGPQSPSLIIKAPVLTILYSRPGQDKHRKDY